MSVSVRAYKVAGWAGSGGSTHLSAAVLQVEAAEGGRDLEALHPLSFTELEEQDGKLRII